MKQTIRRLFARVNSGGVRLLLGFVMLTCMAVFNPTEVLAQKNITVQFKNVPFSKVLSILKEKTSYEYLYNDEEIRRVGNVTASFTNASLSEVLDKCLEGTAFGYRIIRLRM